MKKNNLDIATIRQLHQAGDFNAARDGYLAILQEDHSNVEVLHAIALLYAQNDNFALATDYFKTAIQHDPENPILYLNLGNALKTQGLFADAATAFQQAITLNPHYAAALNNLGTVYYAEGKLTDAIISYRAAIEKQPHYQDAYYNLGLALSKNGDAIIAIDVYEALIAQVPEHAAACFQLACLLLQEGRIKEALDYFVRIEENHPHHFETQLNLANCYLKLGVLNQAKTHYSKALELSPKDAQILFNLGVVCMQQGYTDSAIQYYQRALQINPDDFATHNNIGVAFLAKSHSGYALHHFKEALRLEPNNQAIQYTVSMLSQDKRLLASPPDYIKNLFDAYADHYDLHLLQSLDYQVPEQLLHAVQTVIKNKTATLDILDLGCGTGLCAIPFKPLTKTLTGVDLSPNMLAMAAEKKIYDDLVAANFVTFLTEKDAAYDLIIAGDALVYMGDLTALITSANHALRHAGLFAFNTEITAQTDYTMNQSGRFSHQKNYIDQLALQNGFKTAYYQEVVTRQQNNEAVHGHLYVLQKNA
jgi:predicted TPR repeat methyltransferase